MAQVLLEELDPVILEKIALRAQRHGRSLQAELKFILEQVAETETLDTAAMEVARERAAQMRQELADTIHSNSVELLRADRKR